MYDIDNNDHMLKRQYRTYEKRVLAEYHMYVTHRRMGRRKLWTERLTITLPEGVKEGIDALLVPSETRLDFIRTAIDREMARRLRGLGPKRNRYRLKPPTIS
ncbi:hypothetical protein [Nitrospirillum amazonense]|uniref:hypothetical protein n=1 Tax=Nitrospirillum amazonense TaxID=28077 RepID=UPI002412CF52|nr:hypothetical protein [Nitrospirillum amazonense]MDG3444591.1 hypothetical protein [Nitrospirillum amazonense]